MHFRNADREKNHIQIKCSMYFCGPLIPININLQNKNIYDASKSQFRLIAQHIKHQNKMLNTSDANIDGLGDRFIIQ